MEERPQRKSYRLQKYDYSDAGYYYVTICTNHRIECFGEVRNGITVLNEQGKIAEQFWQEIPKHYQGVDLDVFAVMPNHIHGIIIIKERPADGWPYKATSLSAIIGSYKNIVSKTIRKSVNPDFEWQHSFYDNIIRSEKALDEIREYITNNPKAWELDEDNPRNWKK